jgi:DNA-binding NtrC family response regulator
MVKPRVLIVEDEAQFCRRLEIDFGEEFSFEKAQNMAFAWHFLRREHFDLLLFDLNMKGEDGFEEGLNRIIDVKQQYPNLPLIVVSKDSETADACRAGSNGADNFLFKGRYEIELWRTIFRNTIKIKQIKTNNATSKKTNAPLSNVSIIAEDAHPFIGSSDAICRVREELEGIGQANDNITVLITGETGVGKEVAARYLHCVSQRSTQPFCTVPLSSLQSNLIESELFGHQSGAYTDAKKDKIGYFRQADKGILFLDEIGDINADTQTRLLRFLQDKTMRPIGSDSDIRLDVQTVTATNKDLREEVRNRKFREDLFYRLNFYPVRIPPLRERASDIPLLIAHYLQIPVAEVKATMTSEVYTKLIQNTWQGNIRELSATVGFMKLRRNMQKKDHFDVDCLPDEMRFQHSLKPTSTPSVFLPFGGIQDPSNELSHDEQITLADLDRIEKSLARSSGNKGIAAESLDMTADNLRYRVIKYEKLFPEQVRRFHHINRAYFTKK